MGIFDFGGYDFRLFSLRFLESSLRKTWMAWTGLNRLHVALLEIKRLCTVYSIRNWEVCTRVEDSMRLRDLVVVELLHGAHVATVQRLIKDLTRSLHRVLPR